MAKLVVEVIGASDASVAVDGTIVLRSGKRASTELTRGVHDIAVKASGRKPESLQVDLSAGDKVVEVTLERVKSAGGGGGSSRGSGKASGAGAASGSASTDTGSGSHFDGDALVDPFKKKKPPP
jgi:hypothetical protein